MINKHIHNIFEWKFPVSGFKHTKRRRTVISFLKKITNFSQRKQENPFGFNTQPCSFTTRTQRHS